MRGRRKIHIRTESLSLSLSYQVYIGYYNRSDIARLTSTIMLSLLKKNFSYSSIEDDEYGSELKLDVTSPSRSSKFIIIKTGTLSLLLVAFLFLSSILSTWIVFFNSKAFSARQDIVSSPVPAASSLSCQQAPLRREWRTLTVVEQHDYVRAVRCLTTKPSRIGHNGTLYDDFPWVHKHTSTNSTFSEINPAIESLYISGEGITR